MLMSRRGRRPVQLKPFRVSVCAACSLNATNQSGVTLSPRYENLRAACGPRQEERGPAIHPNRLSQAALEGQGPGIAVPQGGEGEPEPAAETRADGEEEERQDAPADS